MPIYALNNGVQEAVAWKCYLICVCKIHKKTSLPESVF